MCASSGPGSPWSESLIITNICALPLNRLTQRCTATKLRTGRELIPAEFIPPSPAFLSKADNCQLYTHKFPAPLKICFTPHDITLSPHFIWRTASESEFVLSTVGLSSKSAILAWGQWNRAKKRHMRRSFWIEISLISTGMGGIEGETLDEIPLSIGIVSERRLMAQRAFHQTSSRRLSKSQGDGLPVAGPGLGKLLGGHGTIVTFLLWTA